VISVIICTHNPREDFLRRTLAALRAQTLPTTQWELLLIDNASEKSLSALWDLAWQPNARPLRENELGLTSARLRGIREAQGELLVFVDDDNVLADNFLAAAAELFSKRADLGVASGRILP
jgi:glycosyltransferase involved in cell wall biosynthesis